MQDGLSVCLLNDSFPPTVDGVANVVLNYASIIDKYYGESTVVVPKYPNVADDYPFEVVRYPSIGTKSIRPYRAGNPFDMNTLKALGRKPFDVIHTHCPIASAMLARTLRNQTYAPLIMTYHTKFDLDFKRVMKTKVLYDSAVKLMIDNVEACDDVWVVSHGAGENLRHLGYTGSYTVMKNGVDFPKGKPEESKTAEVKNRFGLCADSFNMLFVGRIQWYKGLRIIIDAVKKTSDSGLSVKAVFIGDGTDRAEAEAYAASLGLGSDKCLFAGAVNDRAFLRACYPAFDLFAFPSSFDTNGLVVREAASGGLPAAVLRGSCAAEDITDGENGILIDENAASLASAVTSLYSKRDVLARIGANACRDLYISWDDAVATAVKRYRTIIEATKENGLSERKTDFSSLFKLVTNFCENSEKITDWRENMGEKSSVWFHAALKRMGFQDK